MKQLNSIKIANNFIEDGWKKADTRVINGKTQYVLIKKNRITIVDEDIYNYVKGKINECK